jgi:hypothetical protein
VYQLGILSLSCSQYSQTICWRGWDDNACLGVRNNSIEAWPNFLVWSSLWYCIVSPLLQTNTRQQTNQNLMLWFHRLKEVQKIKKNYRTVGEWQHCNPIQGQNRARTGFSLCTNSQGKTCFHYREPLFSLQGTCIHYRDFPVRISTQGDPCNHYREWVCSVPL